MSMFFLTYLFDVYVSSKTLHSKVFLNYWLVVYVLMFSVVYIST